MIKFREEESLCFDDILLIPQRSKVKSRQNVDLTICGYSFPIVASPMDTVCEWEMAAHIANQGGIGFIHRYMDKSEQLVELQTAISATEKPKNIGIAIAAIDVFDTQYIEDAIDLGCQWFCIDTANGHGDACVNAVEFLRSNKPMVNIMAGNVSTADGFARLSQAGADAVRVGIGGGSVCTTRVVSGHGVPTLQSIMDCYDYVITNGCDTLIVADGGIRNTGDMVKAFAAGADLVMLGSMLAGTAEAPGDIINENGKQYKEFRGMASKKAQLSWRGTSSVEEGISTTIQYKGSVLDIFEQIRGGLGSGCSYSGTEALETLRYVAMYTTISSNSVKENTPHVKH